MKLRGEFITNIDIDSNGQKYLDGVERIVFIGKTKLVSRLSRLTFSGLMSLNMLSIRIVVLLSRR
jgi:hypothetical protein